MGSEGAIICQSINEDVKALEKILAEIKSKMRVGKKENSHDFREIKTKNS